MLEAPLPPNDAERVAALRALRILDTPPEERFDRITRLAQRLFAVPIALVSLVDSNRQWFKSRLGLPVAETPRHISFCGHASDRAKALVIPDTLDDPRFCDNPLVTGEPNIRFYAGQPLAGPGGHWLGTLCILDRRPRQLSDDDLATLRDLAALVEDELNGVDRLKSAFVSLVSHELRTPLTSIKGYADLLLDGEAGALDPTHAEFLGIIKSSADRLVALINDFLDISRIEAGQIELKLTALDLNRLIETVARAQRPQIEAKRQRLELDLPADLPAVSGDWDRVVQILTNLIANAHKYTPTGGRIAIRARPEGERVRVQVEDTGVGLSEEEQAQIFTKFFRARKRSTHAEGGTGLGLAITRSLVEMHGGTMAVSSAPGEGATFSFTLRATRQPAEPEIDLDALPVSRRILVVDHEPNIATLIRRYLERADYQVLTAHRPDEALRLARSERPDLITLDVTPPGAEAFTLLEWLKTDPTTAPIPVVLLSVLPDTGQGKLLGAVDYLVKPVQERVLLERVRAILAAGAGCPLGVASRRTLLVVDDDPDLRALIAGHLRRAGYQVREAGDGAEAVELARRERPALALMDIRMPRMDGIAALRALRESEPTRGLPVIMMTASPGLAADSQSTIEALGGTMLLSKPCSAQELAGVITRGLAGAMSR